MHIQLTPDQETALRKYLAASPDAEELKAEEWVVDFYDTVPPATFNIVFEKSGSLRLDGASALEYDEEQNGWYMSATLESAETILGIFEKAGALSK